MHCEFIFAFNGCAQRGKCYIALAFPNYPIGKDWLLIAFIHTYNRYWLTIYLVTFSDLNLSVNSSPYSTFLRFSNQGVSEIVFCLCERYDLKLGIVYSSFGGAIGFTGCTDSGFNLWPIGCNMLFVRLPENILPDTG